ITILRIVILHLEGAIAQQVHRKFGPELFSISVQVNVVMKSFSVAGIPAVLAFFGALLIARPASAHALGAECSIRQSQVEVEAYSSDDTPARAAWVRVLDNRQNQVAEGRTDDRGRWSFPVPLAGNYQVIVDAGTGHRTQIQIRVPAQPEASRA